MWQVFPETTEFYSSWYDETLSAPERGRYIISLATLPRLARRLRDPSFDLVVVHAPAFSPWSGRGLVRALFRRSVLRGRVPLFRGFGAELLRGPVAAPLAVLDQDDPMTIARGNAFLLDRCEIYFKRELPPDHWQAFSSTLHWRLPTPRFRSVARNRARAAKLRPISLGVPLELAARAATLPQAPDKTVDVFFAGRVDTSSTVRMRGLRELLDLRDAGYAVDIPEAPLSTDDYLQRCARAHLVWSPEGYGWQCFRTYEAAICGSAPLCNRQSIERYRPLVDGVHAVYYDNEPGELARVVKTALADRDRLRAIGMAARQHALAYHLPQEIARHMVAAALQARRDGLALDG